MKQFFTILLYFCFSTFFSQTPSKDETIKWISEKINAYGTVNQGSSSFYTTATDGIIKCKYLENGKEIATSYLNFNDIVDYSKFIWTGGPDDYLKLFTNGKKIASKSSFGTTRESFFDFVLDWNSEINFKNRFLKALDALVEYNKSNIPKEPY